MHVPTYYLHVLCTFEFVKLYHRFKKLLIIGFHNGMQTQCVFLSSQENKRGWELQDGINMNSNVKVQNEVNLHKQKKKAINHLIQNGA
jgi:hypothetical protein